MSAITRYVNQFFHPTAEPLDASDQVKYFSDLSNPSKVIPYQGKLVHVKADGILYICSKNGNTFSWRPVLADNGTAFYLTSAEGETFKITVTRDGVNKGRTMVDYPVVIDHATPED